MADFVVATDSTVRVIHSEGGFEKSLPIPGLVGSLAAGGPDRQVWVGYNRDSTYSSGMWYSYNDCVGAVLRFESAGAYGTEVLPGISTVDLRWHDIDEDGQSELVALWDGHGSLHDGTPGLGGLYSWEQWSYGYSLIPMDSDARYMSTIASLRVTGSDSWGGLFVRGSILLNLGPAAGGWRIFTSYNVQSGRNYTWNSWIDRLTAHPLQGGTAVWSRLGVYSGPVAWDVDLDGSAELLLSHVDSSRQIWNLYLDPVTGDSLGFIESERQLTPWGGTTLSDGVTRGLMWSGDTLLVFSISPSVGVGESDAPLPEGLSLKGNFPNPFNGGTTIEFQATGHGRVEVVIYNALGRITARLTPSPSPSSAGNYHVTWDGRDKDGSDAPSGVYFYRVTQGGQAKSGRLMVLR
jgi:hypothetical protein